MFIWMSEIYSVILVLMNVESPLPHFLKLLTFNSPKWDLSSEGTFILLYIAK